MDRKLQLAGEWWTPQGWHAQRVAIDAAGMIGATENLASGAGDAVYLPAITDLHSHAFQRAMAGLAEHRQGDADDFWSWRTLMYRSLDRLDPDTMLSIATLLYIGTDWLLRPLGAHGVWLALLASYFYRAGGLACYLPRLFANVAPPARGP